MADMKKVKLHNPIDFNAHLFALIKFSSSVMNDYYHCVPTFRLNLQFHVCGNRGPSINDVASFS